MGKPYLDSDEKLGLGIPAAVLGFVAVVAGSGSLEREPGFPLSPDDAKRLASIVYDLDDDSCGDGNTVSELAKEREGLFARYGIVSSAQAKRDERDGVPHSGVDKSDWWCSPTSGGYVLSSDRTQFSYGNRTWTAVKRGGTVFFVTDRGSFGDQWEYSSSDAPLAKSK